MSSLSYVTWKGAQNSNASSLTFEIRVASSQITNRHNKASMIPIHSAILILHKLLKTSTAIFKHASLKPATQLSLSPTLRRKTTKKWTTKHRPRQKQVPHLQRNTSSP